MPLLYRNVVPNVPAWTVGNGKLVYRGNAPSCQAEMIFTTTWGGTLDFTECVAYEYSSYTFRKTVFSADEINAALATPRSSGLNHNEVRTVYNDGPTWTGVYVRDQLVNITNGGVLVGRITRMTVSIGFTWEAAKQWWKWHAEVPLLTFGLVDTDGRAYNILICNGPSHRVEYEAAQTTASIRADGGVTIPFARVIDPLDPWTQSVFANSSLVVSARYA